MTKPNRAASSAAGQHYSDPRRASGPTALPDLEVFWVEHAEMGLDVRPAGWYWWSCLPGCLPDSDADGPYDTSYDALQNARRLIGEQDLDDLEAEDPPPA